MAQPVICEYIIQNEHAKVNGRQPGPDLYPNIFLLPKKYTNINDVKLSDVIDAFPDAEKYYLRFE